MAKTFENICFAGKLFVKGNYSLTDILVKSCVKYLSPEIFGDLDQNLRILFESHMISTWENMSSISLEVFVHLNQNLSIFLTFIIFN